MTFEISFCPKRILVRLCLVERVNLSEFEMKV